MAFNMKRPVIKGTQIHKASIAKAKSESIVSQARTQADSTLVASSNALGLSGVPEAQSYKLKSYDLSGIEDKRVGKKKPTKYDPTEDPDYNDEEIQADLDRITAEDGKTPKPKSKKKGYENWKVREEKENIRLAEEGKARSDAASAKRVAAAEAKAAKAKIKADNDKTAKSKADADAAKAEALAAANAAEKIKADASAAAEKDRLQVEKDNNYVGEGSIDNPNERYEDTEGYKAIKNKAAADYKVKLGDLERKTINGTEGWFPKQSAVGGNYTAPDEKGIVGGTQWDDELGRFRIPTGGLSDEGVEALSDKDKEVYNTEIASRNTKAAEEAEKLRPKAGSVNTSDINTTMLNEGQIKLNLDSNTYEYTDLYHSTKAKVSEKALNSQTPKANPEATVEQGLTPRQVRENRMADKKYNNPKTSEYIKSQMIKEGYNPIKSKSPAQMRDNRIYQFAQKDGPVRRNMIKSGYTPE